jgi:hypothetical protein
MSSTIHASKKHKRTTAEKDDDSDVEDDFADEPEGDDQSDGEESNEKDDGSSVTVNDFPGESFDIGQTISNQKTLLTCLLKKTCCQRKPSQRKFSLALLHQRKCSWRKAGRCSQYVLLF